MVVCAFVFLFLAQTNVDLVHTVNSPSELLSTQPIIIRLTSVFVLPITSSTGGNQDTPAWRGRILLNLNNLWLEGRKTGVLWRREGLGPPEQVPLILKNILEDFYLWWD